MTSETPCLPECGFSEVKRQFQKLVSRSTDSEFSYLWHMQGCPAAESCGDFPNAPKPESILSAMARVADVKAAR